MRRKLPLIILGAGVALLGLGAGLYFRIWQPANLAFSPAKPPAEKLVSENKSFQESGAGYEIRVSYPVFSGLREAGILAEINDSLKSGVDKNLADFYTSVEELSASELPIKTESFLSASSTTHFLNNDLISLEMLYSSYLAGAAHPFSYVESFSYDVKNQQPLALRDLFLPGIDYLNLVAEKSRQQLLARLDEDNPFSDQEFILSGTAPEEGNYQTFGVTADSLIVVFQLYQVAPYAAGIQRVEIPYSEIKDALNLNGPLQTVSESW